ncbi:uncharacterized protein N7473_001385 [Penicillium subrubescens]|uniref:uncharacterized protein n=1 Tax=Penicillium subrubescens TaxID=1316194 RepID=UPI002544D76B|nr:uncharacterized protein N7473_001385 [Penicillium subrubescens]KAJ5912082.1 hypothetical protein N7473_001385 [Penicillium subrubescens]
MATAGERKVKVKVNLISPFSSVYPIVPRTRCAISDVSSDFLIMRICDVGRRGPVNVSPRLTRAQSLAIAECRKAPPTYHVDRLGLSLLE